MSKEIDEKVVSMEFDHKNFMENTAETMTRLDKLKQSLRLPGAAKGLEEVNSAANGVKLGPLGTAAEQVALKFNALQVMATTALMNITNTAMNTAKRMVSAFTIDPIKTGLQEYETQINAVQTILANTESKGTTLDDVNKALDTLNTYADKTIYNFTEMTRNIGTFTAAGVDLDTSVNAIQGIANLAAVSGSNSQQASTAMYQLSQALSSGTVKLMDWNSVVNAGMGGQVFQDALKETARVHGIAIDDMITENGSFRETLQEGWLTSEILTETLQKFTMATEGLTEEQIEQNRAMLKAKGYSDEQIESIFKLGNTATNAATKVKTFTQLMDTLKESAQSGWTQTWEILVGDFEEAKKLWTSVSDVFGKIINDAAEARNTMLQGWADGGGREMALESFKNAWQAIVSIVKPIKEAFREIFPRTTAEQLIKITEAIKNFTSKLILSEKAQEKLKSAFKGLFAVVDIGVTAIKEIVKGVAKLLGYFTDLIGGVLGVSGSFGDWVSGIRDTIKESGVFGTVIGGVVKIIQLLFDKIKMVVSALKEKFVTPGFEGFLAVMTGVWNVVKFVADKIMQVLGALGKGLLNAFRNGDFKSAMDVLNTGIIATILLKIKGFMSSLSDGFSSLGGVTSIVDDIKGIFGSVKDALSAFQQDLQAKTLLKIASAIAILAASILVIASIDPVKLTTSLGAITVLFTELMGAMAVFSNIGTGGKGKGKNPSANFIKMSVAMIAMSTAILILASALKKISDIEPEKMAIGLLGIAGLSAIVVTVATVMSQNSKKIMKGATGLIAFALGIKILASACEDISELSWGSLAKGLIGVGALMAAVSLFLNNTKFSLKAASTGVGIVLIAASMKILASACSDFSSMNWDELGRGLAAMAGALTLVTIAVNLMPKNMVSIGVGLLGVSAALLVMSSVLKTFGGMSSESIGKSLIVLGGALGILAIGLNVMSGTLSGSAALVIASIAIGLLTPSLLILGSMSWEGIIKGLVGIAGAFTIIGVAASILGPLLPAILGLAGAITLIGVGVLAAGVGLMAFSAGLTALAMSMTANAASMVATITIIGKSIIGLIPGLIAAIAEGIVLICKVIIDSAGTICEAIAAIIVAICDAVIKATPKIVKCIGTLLGALLEFIVKYVPKIVVAGMKLIIGLLDGIEQNIGKIVEKAVRVVSVFIIAIGREIPNLIEAGFQMILEFIYGIGDAIETYTPLLMDACIDLGASIVRGIVKGLGSIPGAIWDGIKSVGSTIKNGFKSFFGINSPAKEMIFIGQGIDEGIVVGLEQYKGSVVNATEDVGSTVIKSMSNAISGISDIIESDMDSQPTIRPVLDLSDVESGANAINGMLGMTPSIGVLSNVGAIDSMMNSNQNRGTFDIKSAFEELGNRITSGSGNTYIINGITYDDGSNVSNAIGELMRAARIERRV